MEVSRGLFWGTYNSHALSEDVHQALVVDGARAGEEEVGDGEVEEGDGGDDGLGGDESHGCNVGVFIARCPSFEVFDEGGGRRGEKRSRSRVRLKRKKPRGLWSFCPETPGLHCLETPRNTPRAATLRKVSASQEAQALSTKKERRCATKAK